MKKALKKGLWVHTTIFTLYYSHLILALLAFCGSKPISATETLSSPAVLIIKGLVTLAKSTPFLVNQVKSTLIVCHVFKAEFLSSLVILSSPPQPCSHFIPSCTCSVGIVFIL